MIVKHRNPFSSEGHIICFDLVKKQAWHENRDGTFRNNSYSDWESWVHAFRVRGIAMAVDPDLLVDEGL